MYNKKFNVSTSRPMTVIIIKTECNLHPIIAFIYNRDSIATALWTFPVSYGN